MTGGPQRLRREDRTRNSAGQFSAKRAVCRCGNLALPRRAICDDCRLDSRRRSRYEALHRLERQKLAIEAEAERATRHLKKKDAFTPLDGEAIVNRWLRGEE